jgi:hypothetical protein
MKTKHFGFLLLVATVAVACLSACGNKQKAEQEVVADVPNSIAEQAVVVDETKPKAEGVLRCPKVFYVVLGSYESLENAIKATGETPDFLLSPVYKAEEKGEVKYRLCCDCYYSKEKALERKQELEELVGNFITTWIWESDGLAECVYQPKSLRDENELIPALTPQ